MYYYGGGSSCGCGSTPIYNSYPMGYGCCGGGNSSSFAIILVLFILLVIVIGARGLR